MSSGSHVKVEPPTGGYIHGSTEASVWDEYIVLRKKGQVAAREAARLKEERDAIITRLNELARRAAGLLAYLGHGERAILKEVMGWAD